MLQSIHILYVWFTAKIIHNSINVFQLFNNLCFITVIVFYMNSIVIIYELYDILIKQVHVIT